MTTNELTPMSVNHAIGMLKDAMDDQGLTDDQGLARVIEHLESLGEHRCSDPEQASYEAQETFGISRIWVRHWGATMALADFYVIIPIQDSKREVAVKLQNIKYGPFGAQRTVPTPIMSAYECHEVRVRDGQPEARFR